MVSLPQLRRDLLEVESQPRFTRNRLTCYETLSDTELAEYTGRMVVGLEGTKEVIVARI